MGLYFMAWYNLRSHRPAARSCCLPGWSSVNSWNSLGWVFCNSHLRRILYLSHFLLIFFTWCSLTFSQWFMWCSSKYCNRWRHSQSGSLNVACFSGLICQHSICCGNMLLCSQLGTRCLSVTPHIDAQSCQATSMYRGSTWMILQCRHVQYVSNKSTMLPCSAPCLLEHGKQDYLRCWLLWTADTHDRFETSMHAIHQHAHTAMYKQAVPLHQAPHCWG